MRSSIKVALSGPAKSKEMQVQTNHFLVCSIIFFAIYQSILLYFLLPGNLKYKAVVGLMMFSVEGAYICLFYIIKRLFKTKLSVMFLHSSFLNIGILFTLAFVSPFIISAIMHNLEFLKYYLCALSVMFLLACLYVKPLDVQIIIANSLKNQRLKRSDGELIIFGPNTVWDVLRKVSVLTYIPYVVALILGVYAFALRTGAESIRTLTASMFLYSVLLLYTEFCYFLLWLKYLINYKE